MLVLSRQRDEHVIFDFASMSDEELLALRRVEVSLCVVDIRGDKVRMGFTAPPQLKVHRKEVFEAIRRENRAAQQVKIEDVAGLTNGQ